MFALKGTQLAQLTGKGLLTHTKHVRYMGERTFRATLEIPDTINTRNMRDRKNEVEKSNANRKLGKIFGSSVFGVLSVMGTGLVVDATMFTTPLIALMDPLNWSTFGGTAILTYGIMSLLNRNTIKKNTLEAAQINKELAEFSVDYYARKESMLGGKSNNENDVLMIDDKT